MTYKSVYVKGHPLFPHYESRNADEHRVIVSEREGRVLRTDEHVHHKDEDKTNNNPDNLELMSRDEHIRLHLKGKARPEVAAKMLGRKHTPEAIENMRQAAALRTDFSELGIKGGAIGGRAGKGKPKSLETRKRMSEAAKRNNNHLHFKGESK